MSVYSSIKNHMHTQTHSWVFEELVSVLVPTQKKNALSPQAASSLLEDDTDAIISQQ